MNEWVNSGALIIAVAQLAAIIEAEKQQGVIKTEWLVFDMLHLL